MQPYLMPLRGPGTPGGEGETVGGGGGGEIFAGAGVWGVLFPFLYAGV